MEKLKMHTPDLTEENFRKLAALFPNAVTEAKNENGEIVRAIDADVLRQEISAEVVEGRKERYQFTWPDKKKSIVLANARSTKALRLEREKSVGRDGTEGSIDTENIYIEGDNLDALKLLRETYLGQVKMIYIDPPYNTTKDSFVYDDDFTMPNAAFAENSGAVDENGNQMFDLRVNNESNGRFHTDWLNMIYPRLRLARDFLADDGVIFISIDDHEQENLKKICDEIFGAKNFIATMIWQQGKKSSGNLIGINHEYIIVYAKNRVSIDTPITGFKARKEGLDKIHRIYDKLKAKFGSDYKKISEGMRAFFESLPENDIAYNHRMYNLVDESGLFQSGDAAAPDKPETRSHRPLIHPITKKPTKVPSMGWRFKDKTLDELVKKGYILFGEDETKVPRVKRYLKEYEFELPSTVFYKPGASASSEIQRIFGNKVFEHPKDRNELKRIFDFIRNKDALILDFFSGSATTAHAVMQLNAEDGGNRKFIMVQLPEITAEKSEARKAGYDTICDIGEERIRRAGKKIKEETGADIDYGFRVLRVDSTNMRDVYYRTQDLKQTEIELLADNIKEDRTPEDLLFQVMLELDILLSSKIEEKDIAGKKVFMVEDNYLIACFDVGVTEEVVTAIAKKNPVYAVFRDSSIASDAVMTNFEQIFKTHSPQTEWKVL